LTTKNKFGTIAAGGENHWRFFIEVKMAGNPRKLKGLWTAAHAADFAAFHGNKSYIPHGRDFLEPETMFRIKEYPDDTYVVIEKHHDHHIVFSNADGNKVTHEGGFDLNHIEILKGK